MKQSQTNQITSHISNLVKDITPLKSGIQALDTKVATLAAQFESTGSVPSSIAHIKHQVDSLHQTVLPSIDERFLDGASGAAAAACKVQLDSFSWQLSLVSSFKSGLDDQPLTLVNLKTTVDQLNNHVRALNTTPVDLPSTLASVKKTVEKLATVPAMQRATIAVLGDIRQDVSNFEQQSIPKICTDTNDLKTEFHRLRILPRLLASHSSDRRLRASVRATRASLTAISPYVQQLPPHVEVLKSAIEQLTIKSESLYQLPLAVAEVSTITSDIRKHVTSQDGSGMLLSTTICRLGTSLSDLLAKHDGVEAPVLRMISGV